MKNIIFLFCIISFSTFANAKDQNYSLECYLKPCKLEGDFDGDGRQESAVLVRNSEYQLGIKITFSTKKSHVIGAGQCFGSGGCSFNWMDRWTIVKDKKIKQGATELRSPPRSKGDFLLLEKINSASGIAYWDGKQFQWYQQGD